MTHVPKDTHPWNTLHPEDRFPESRSGAGVEAGATLRGQQSPHLDLGGTLEASTEEETPPPCTQGTGPDCPEGCSKFPISVGI